MKPQPFRRSVPQAHSERSATGRPAQPVGLLSRYRRRLGAAVPAVAHVSPRRAPSAGRLDLSGTPHPVPHHLDQRRPTPGLARRLLSLLALSMGPRRICSPPSCSAPWPTVQAVISAWPSMTRACTKPGCGFSRPSYQRDPLSPKYHVNFMLGLRFLQASLLVPLFRRAKVGTRALPIAFEEVSVVKRPRRKRPPNSSPESGGQTQTHVKTESRTSTPPRPRRRLGAGVETVSRRPETP